MPQETSAVAQNAGELETAPGYAHQKPEEYVPAGAGAADVPLMALKDSRHVKAFDGMRGLAILMVLAGHLGYLPLGAAGVDVFFVLSGYLITGLLLKELDETGGVVFKNFYMRRWLRLAPALLLLVGMYVIWTLVMRRSPRQMAVESAIALFYVANWARAYGHVSDMLAHAWSLSVEEQFYIVWPVMVVGLHGWLKRRWVAALVCVAGVVAVVVYRGVLMAHGATDMRLINGLDTRADSLLTGAALTFYTPRLGRWGALLVGWAGVAAFAVYLTGRFGQHGSISAAFVVKNICTAAVLAGVVNARGGMLSRVLAFGPLAWVGTISYGLYLYHFPISKYLLFDMQWKSAEATLVVVPAAFVLATLSYYLVERRFLRMKKWFPPGKRVSVMARCREMWNAWRSGVRLQGV